MIVCHQMDWKREERRRRQGQGSGERERDPALRQVGKVRRGRPDWLLLDWLHRIGESLLHFLAPPTRLADQSQVSQSAGDHLSGLASTSFPYGFKDDDDDDGMKSNTIWSILASPPHAWLAIWVWFLAWAADLGQSNYWWYPSRIL